MHALALTIVLFVAQQAPAKPAPLPTVAGKWNVSLEMQSGTASPTLELTQEGEKVGGFYQGRYGKFALTGTLKGKALQFTFTMSAEGTEVVMKFRGDVSTDFQTIKGTAELGEMGEAAFTAKRADK